MENVLGLELHEAEKRLAASGYEVSALEVSSRKGVRGNETRVIRQREIKCSQTGTIIVELCFSIFKTDVDFVKE